MTANIQMYVKLLQDFGAISQDYIDEKKDQNILGLLKTEYEEIIDSKRTLENIVDIKGLLNVLEKRGLLQFDDIQVLHYIAHFLHDQRIDELILNYEHFIVNHVHEINNLYSCGKLSNLIINSEHYIFNEYKTNEDHNSLHKNIPNLESEDQCNNKSLLLKVSNVAPNELKCINKRKVLGLTFFQKWSKQCKQYKYIFIIIVLLFLLVLIISIISIFYLSIAIVSKIEDSNPLENQFQSKIPSLTPDVNLEFPANPSTIHVLTTSMSIAAHEKDLQTLVVDKVSRRIGKYWAEVCRRLDIDEVDIDEIENRYVKEVHSYEKMFKEALQIYFSEKHPNWKRDLIKALEASKRRDLKEEVEKMVY